MPSVDDDLKAIEHLDFDALQDNAVPCDGYMFRKGGTGEILEANTKCQNPPILIATYACCGLRIHLCMSCHNWKCRAYTSAPPTVGFRHTPCNTVVFGRPFLDKLELL